jgi:membrane-associated protease RseP (regulator of RpoE activity)
MPRRRLWLHAALFLATAATTVVAGAGQSSLPADADALGIFLAGLPYASAILGILAAHELGHWLMARAWGVDATLPYFIPGPPFAGVGTLGAVIRIRSALPSRRSVLDVGAAGPIAGFAVAVPLLVLGLLRSEVRPVGDALLEVGNAGSPLALARAFFAGEEIRNVASSVQLMGDSLLTAWVQRLALGPVPPGHDVFLHPVAFAAWVGLLITALNLLPVGQLDGGHVLYALLGRRRALAVSRLAAWGLLACGLVLSWSWLLWWVIARFIVRPGHPPALEEEPLDRGRAAVALASLVILILTFVPVPVSM